MAEGPLSPRLLFVSPQFLFPMDAGGKIRTANILKNLKGGAFQIELIAPATPDEKEKWAREIGDLCDVFNVWCPESSGARQILRRFTGLLSALPVSIASDLTPQAWRAVAEAAERRPDIIVFDYAHSFALAPEVVHPPSLIFAHNVETEIFRRHAQQTKGLMNFVWRLEAAKMARFEKHAVQSVDGVIAVSDRDAAAFKESFGASWAEAIPTGVDLDFFSYRAPQESDEPVMTFTGSMDWRANQDGLAWFMDEVWSLIAAERPDAMFVAIGKNPPKMLVERAAERGLNWRFTGFVDDVREHARGAIYVIPLRVGGGTRIKAFEAMAMGVPVVSTALGVEGLPVEAGKNFLQAETPDAFAGEVLRLLAEPTLRTSLAQAARRFVEENSSQKVAAQIFEAHCLEVLNRSKAS